MLVTREKEKSVRSGAKNSRRHVLMILVKRVLGNETVGLNGRGSPPRHWLPDASTYTLVNRLDDAASDVTQASPTTPDEEVQRALSGLKSVVTLTFASWNQVGECLRRLESLRQVA